MEVLIILEGDNVSIVCKCTTCTAAHHMVRLGDVQEFKHISSVRLNLRAACIYVPAHRTRGQRPKNLRKNELTALEHVRRPQDPYVKLHPLTSRTGWQCEQLCLGVKSHRQSPVYKLEEQELEDGLEDV